MVLGDFKNDPLIETLENRWTERLAYYYISTLDVIFKYPLRFFLGPAWCAYNWIHEHLANKTG